MLGELSGSLAHELNQPLTAILSNAQAAQRFLAQSPPRVDKLAEILTDIVKSDHRAGAVIQRLRSLLRKEDAQRHTLDINEVVEESLRLMRSDLLNRRVVVNTDLADALPVVSGDRNQLQQVLLNLMSYATLPAGSATINKNGTTYYLNGNTWFQPAYGANGVHYQVVPAP